MKWVLPNNRIININIGPSLIDWDKKAPSKGAQATKDFLKKHCYVQCIGEEFRIPKTRLRCDFVLWNLKVALEFDGLGVHDAYNKHFHKSRIGFLNSIKRDCSKDAHFDRNGFKMIRITEDDLPLTKEFFSVNYEIYL